MGQNGAFLRYSKQMNRLPRVILPGDRERIALPGIFVVFVRELFIRHELLRMHESLTSVMDSVLKTGLINRANGSSYVEIEKVKIACAV